ncbi:MAG TPA: CBS domain-containing protein [Candidatus Limnocylindrales bacterium]|jgi:CBS domain-containing protein
MMTICPVCHHPNFAGEDTCAECGADLTAVDLPQDAIDFHGRLLGEHLDQLGAAPPLTVPTTMALDEAIRLMHSGPVDCLLVVADDRLVGIFTDRDAVVRTVGLRLSSFLVRDYMTRDPVVLRHDETIAVAINKMAIGGFRHIPIVEDGHPIGVVAAPDIFQHILNIIG